MNWLPIALSTAIFASLSDAFTKAYLREGGTVQMAMGRVLAPILFLTPLLLFIKWPHLDLVFWKTLAFLLPLETSALLLYMEALRVSPLSLTIPFLAFTPAFMIVTGYLILGESLSMQGILGVLLIVAGSYSLHLTRAKLGILEPLLAIVREKGSWLMLLVAIIYSITSVLGKLAIEHSAPLFFASFYFIVHGLFATTILSLFFKTRPLEVVKRYPKGVFMVGLAQSLMVMTHMWAISLAPAAYMIAVKRLSVLFGVIIGCLFFKEKEMLVRLSGASLMVMGVFLIALS